MIIRKKKLKEEGNIVSISWMTRTDAFLGDGKMKRYFNYKKQY